MIAKAIHWSNGTVMVFDERGNQLPEHQGLYTNVRQSVLDNAPDNCVFMNGYWDGGRLEMVDRDSW